MPSFGPRKKFPAEIFILKGRIFGQNGQNEVQRSSNNCRTVKATKILIQYSESAENSLSPMYQILPSSTSLGSKNNLKMAYFDPKNMHFSSFFEISRPTTCHMRTKFGTMIAPRSTKKLKKTAHPYLS